MSRVEELRRKSIRLKNEALEKVKDYNGKNISIGDEIIVVENLGVGEVELTYRIIWQDNRFVVRGVNNNNNIEIDEFDFSVCELTKGR